MDRSDLTIEYIRKYGQHMSKRSLAHKLWQEHPDKYKDAENARSSIRQMVGMNGNATTERLRLNQHFVQMGPEILVQDMFYYITEEKANINAIMDVHVPFHDPRAVEVAINRFLKKGTDILILNGDILDHYSNGKYEKDARKRDFEYDYEQSLSFLFELRCAFPDAKILFKIGNHEMRWETHFVRNGMREIANIDYFQYEKVFELDKLNIVCLKDYVTIKVGEYNIIHGHEYKGGSLDKPAKWLSLRTNESAICGHFHRPDDYELTTHSGKQLNYHSVGCLSLLNPKYLPYNRWGHGFLEMEKDGDHVDVFNRRITKSYKIKGL